MPTPSPSPLSRLGAASLAIGGVLNAAFLIVAAGKITGASAMLSAQWSIAHNLHFAAGMLLLFGVVGVYQLQFPQLGVFGHFAFLLALMGCAFFFAGGVITAALMPVIAAYAPTLVRATGPLFNPPLPILLTSIALFSIGWILFGLATARARVFPAWTGWAVAAGALLQGVPPQPFGPVPWIVVDVGGVIMAAGLVVIGARGWRMAETIEGTRLASAT